MRTYLGIASNDVRPHSREERKSIGAERYGILIFSAVHASSLAWFQDFCYFGRKRQNSWKTNRDFYWAGKGHGRNRLGRPDCHPQIQARHLSRWHRLMIHNLQLIKNQFLLVPVRWIIGFRQKTSYFQYDILASPALTHLATLDRERTTDARASNEDQIDRAATDKIEGHEGNRAHQWHKAGVWHIANLLLKDALILAL